MRSASRTRLASRRHVFGPYAPFNNNLNRKLTACMKAATITEAGICLHSFRHSFASWLDSLGVPHGAVQALMGYASRDMTFHYTYSFPQDRQAAVDKLGRAVKDATEALLHERAVCRKCAPDPESEKEVA